MKLRPLALVLEGGVCGLALAYGARKSQKQAQARWFCDILFWFVSCVGLWLNVINGSDNQ